MSFKTVFNLLWMDKNAFPEYADWIKNIPSDPYVARCIWCMKTFSLSNMGKQAISSHQRSVKHVKFLKTQSMQSSLKDLMKIVPCSSTSVGDSSSLNSAMIKNYVFHDSVTKAEIVWAMKLVTTHSSFNSFDDIAEVFSCMFSDSETAKKCSLGRTKMSYLVCFGIAPYFKSLLEKSIRNTKFVVYFDEALNRIAQKGQLDIHLRYWCSVENKVMTRYWNSVFMEHATSDDILKHFKNGCTDLDLKMLLQISMDGPNVNLKFLQHIKDNLKENETYILDMGTCGLHIVHGALQFGHKATNWSLNETFRALHQLFKDSPVRRADFIAVSGCVIFPLKFCQCRWIENVKVAERAINVFPHVVKYIERSKSLPNTITCDNVKKACHDKLILAKFAFFSYLASILESFLRRFQATKPMVPFLYNAYFELIYQLMQIFIKHDVLNQTTTCHQMLCIDLSLQSNIKALKDIDIGVATELYLNKSNTLNKNEYRNDCLKFVKKTTCKIIERTNISLQLLRSASSLDPNLLKTSPKLCKSRMSKLLQIFLEKKIGTPQLIEKSNIQFDIFLRQLSVDKKLKEELENFQESNHRLDDFYYTIIGKNDKFVELWEIVKNVLILSQGNAPVESGFSINKDMLVENLGENSLIGLRTVYDGVKAAGGVCSVQITKDLLQHARAAHSRYRQALENKKTLSDNKQRSSVEEKKLADQVRILEQKKRKLMMEKEMEAKRLDEEINTIKKIKFKV